MNKWNKSIKKEKEFWEKHIIQKFINVPHICEACNYGEINLINLESEINRIVGKCNFYTCKKTTYLRKDTIFEYHK